jgi:nucleoside-diphosphate-sugar epimerase
MGLVGEELIEKLIEDGVTVVAVNGSHPQNLEDWARVIRSAIRFSAFLAFLCP